MQYEDLKDVFYFKTDYGMSEGTFKADKVSKHNWRVYCDLDDDFSDWDCDDFLCYLNEGEWVIQEEEDTGKPVEKKQNESTIDVKTLRDEFAMVALQGWIAGQPTVEKQPLDGTEDHAKLVAEVAYRYADAMMKARKESL